MAEQLEDKVGKALPRPVQWYESLQFRLSIGLLVILGILILAFMTVNQTLLRSVLIENNFDLVEQAGTGLVTELGQQVEATEALTRSIASLVERLPFDEKLYKQVVPHLMKTGGNEEIIAGGGVWPEPYQFDPSRERRSFFWARKFDNQLKYYDDYNAPEGLGYHREEWYVPAKYVGRDRCFWSKSYMDPYSLEPMVTCSVPMHREEEMVGVATVDVKLAGLQQFFATRAEKLGGYAFAVDRNNKFLSYPALDMVKVVNVPGKQNQAREFVTVREFATRHPDFKPIAARLQEFSDQLLSLAQEHGGYDPGLSELIANESYQINRHEAQMISATFADPLSPGNGAGDFKSSVRFSMSKDLILGEPVLVSMFIMPKVYWKIVVVTPQQPLIDRASEVTGQILTVLIAIILVSMAGAFLWLRRALVRPLAAMTGEISASPLGGVSVRPLREKGFTEIDLLGSTINRMRDQLSMSFEELRESENRFRLIAESLPEGLVIARRSDGKVLYLNRRLRELFAIPPEEDEHKLRFLDFYDDPADRAQLLLKLQTTNVVSDFVIPARRLDGTRFWMSVSTCAISFMGEDALVTGVIDVTKRKQAEDEVALYRSHLEQMVEERTAELEGAKQVALQAAAAKQNFLANMSHEIRTPLNSIVGIGHLLLMKEHLPAQNRYLLNLNKAGKILLKIINDILDITKMDVGKLKAEAVEFDLDDVLDDLSIHIRPMLAEKSIDAYLLRPANLDRKLVGDPLKLQQVLLNLITNAIKFTHQGYVECDIRFDPLDGDRAELFFNVRDTGIGIPKDKMESIFNAFTQADSATTREYGGTGLGLAISKTLVQLMGGSISVESKPGEGSCFRFQVPMGLAAQDKENPFAGLDSPVHVLTISNDERELNSLERLFSRLSMMPVTAGFDAGAVDILKAAAVSDHPFEVLLMDWDQDKPAKQAMLAGLKASGVRDKLAVIAVTQSITTEDERMLDTGILDAVLSRPVRISRLKSSIGTLLNMEIDAPHLPLSPGGRDRPLADVRILLVEDNEQNQFVVEELMGDAGAEITIAGNGRHALDLIRDRGADAFDIVLMDLHMPVMDGFEAVRLIRRDFGPEELPVIALTAEVFQEVVDKCHHHGMNDYLAKPINPSHAIEVISRWSRRSGRDAVPMAKSEDLVAVPGDPLEHLSLEGGLANLDGRRSLYQKMLRDYLDKYSDFEGELSILLASGPSEEAARFVHTFCGLSGTIGATGLEKAARLFKKELDDCRKNEDVVPPDPESLVSALGLLLLEIRRVLEEGFLDRDPTIH
ncbi:ATP-binding protein [Aestuariispira insulae]|uniref:histidine kinase n=1 Tax=Aestuariispira insulae TaxID=1461337 RepID=A0A3D9HJG5_9PROT|nr:ATP-binding protein [Aestuariispira insulae]RED49056.1 PAS domain S-box-containing protein [Aestuariispira insulae]